MEKERAILEATEKMVRARLEGEGSGHDWWHIVRVRQLALKLAEMEGGNAFICQLAALVHDLVDDKLVADSQLASKNLSRFLSDQGVEEAQLDQVLDIIASISYKKSLEQAVTLSLEGKIVQDADRLDALGAVGIARVMAYSGSKGRVIHDPAKLPRENLTAAIYRSGDDTAILHFYEKLLKLKGQMNTDTAKEMAEKRHDFMVHYLQEFYEEWDGNC